MVSENLPSRRIPAELSESHGTEGSYVDWAAILAGGVFALAISFLLISFGASLGLSLTSPYGGEGVSASWLAIAAGIWFAWVMVTSFGAGGYLAGRMRRHAGDATPDEVALRDGAHGLMVWAIGALVSTVLAAAGAGGLVSAGASAVGSAAGTVTDVAADVAASDYFANVMLRRAPGDPEAGPEAGPEAASGAEDTATAAPEQDATQDPEAGAATDDTASSTGSTGTAAASGQSADASQDMGQDMGQDISQPMGVDPAVQQEIAGIIARSVTSGEMAERDRSYLVQLVAANSELDEDAARTRVDAVTAEIDDARATALDAVETARVAGVVFGFIAAATLLIGAVAAFFAATAGGHHRDEGLGLDILMARR